MALLIKTIHMLKAYGSIWNKKPWRVSWLVCSKRILLLADVFENFRAKCVQIYALDPARFSSAPVLAWEACLKKTRVKLELLTDIDMLLMVHGGIRGGICQAIYRYAKASNKYMSNHDKRIIIPYLMYLDANSLYEWAMSQKLPINGFKRVKNLLKFN